MAKRVDPKHDATQEVSLSQLLPDPPPAPHAQRAAPRGNPQNDASMWIGSVVGSDDFAPTAKKPIAPAGNRKLIWALVLLVGGAATGAAVWYMSSGSNAPATAASASPSPAPTSPAPTPAAPPPAATAAAVPATTTTAAVAQPTVTAPAMVDAISSVGAPIKQKAVKKKVVRKQAATKKKAAPAKRR